MKSKWVYFWPKIIIKHIFTLVSLLFYTKQAFIWHIPIKNLFLHCWVIFTWKMPKFEDLQKVTVNHSLFKTGAKWNIQASLVPSNQKSFPLGPTLATVVTFLEAEISHFLSKTGSSVCLLHFTSFFDKDIFCHNLQKKI